MIKTDVCCSICRFLTDRERRQLTDGRLERKAQVTMLFCGRAGRELTMIFDDNRSAEKTISQQMSLTKKNLQNCDKKQPNS